MYLLLNPRYIFKLFISVCCVKLTDVDITKMFLWNRQSYGNLLLDCWSTSLLKLPFSECQLLPFESYPRLNRNQDVHDGYHRMVPSYWNSMFFLGGGAEAWVIFALWNWAGAVSSYTVAFSWISMCHAVQPHLVLESFTFFIKFMELAKSEEVHSSMIWNVPRCEAPQSLAHRPDSWSWKK